MRVVLDDLNLANAERLIIREAVQFHATLEEAAAACGITVSRLKRKLEQHGIKPPNSSEPESTPRKAPPRVAKARGETRGKAAARRATTASNQDGASRAKASRAKDGPRRTRKEASKG